MDALLRANICASSWVKQEQTLRSRDERPRKHGLRLIAPRERTDVERQKTLRQVHSRNDKSLQSVCLLGNETQTRKIALQLGERVRWDWLTFWNEQICKLL